MGDQLITLYHSLPHFEYQILQLTQKTLNLIIQTVNTIDAQTIY